MSYPQNDGLDWRSFLDTVINKPSSIGLKGDPLDWLIPEPSWLKNLIREAIAGAIKADKASNKADKNNNETDKFTSNKFKADQFQARKFKSDKLKNDKLKREAISSASQKPNEPFGSAPEEWNVFETHKSVFLRREVPPHIKPYHIRVFVNPKTIRIKGLNGKKAVELKLPAVVNPDASRATIQDGVLEIGIRKASVTGSKNKKSGGRERETKLQF